MPLSKEKILLFGGSFNPFHFGHLKILKQAEQTIQPNKIFIIPSGYNPEKNISFDEFISNEDRLKILELSLSNYQQYLVSDFEIKNDKFTYTYQTIAYFKKQFPNSEVYLLIGADQWNQFHMWKNYLEILKDTKIVVAKRNNVQINNSNLDIDPIIIPGINYEISSTLIRLNPKPFFVPNNVLNYINDHGLYAINRIKSLMSEHRFNHSLRVAFMCKELMNKFDNKQSILAYTAGIYHDIAKEMDYDNQINIAENILGIYDYGSPKVLHGYIGAYLLQTKYFFTNKNILNAICRHTKPYDYYNEEPTLLDKVLYLSDKLEPNRNNDDVFGEDINYYRKLAFNDPNKCFEELLNLIQSKITKK